MINQKHGLDLLVSAGVWRIVVGICQRVYVEIKEYCPRDDCVKFEIYCNIWHLPMQASIKIF